MRYAVRGFQATGLLDIIEHQRCGYLAQPYETEDLASGIAWVLEDNSRHAELSRRARLRVVEEFGLDKVSARYITIYRELLENR